jgi:hypothetical protein
MNIKNLLETMDQLNEGIVPANKAKSDIPEPKRTMNPQPGVKSRIEPSKDPKVVAKKLAGINPGDPAGNFVKGGKELGIFKEEGMEEAVDLPGNQDRLDVAEPKGKITGADFKKLRAGKKESVEEGTKETKHGRVHKAEPGGYGRKFDTDEHGDEKKEKKAEPEKKRGRGRPKKHSDDTGHVKTYDFSKDLQSFMVGNLPKGGKLPGKPGKKHKLKDWMEHVEANMIAESQSISEVALDPSQLAVPKVAGTGTQTTAQAAGAAKPGQQMGAAVVDFKNPQDPLKAALQKAVQQKQVSVLGEEDVKFEDMTDKELIQHCKQMGLEKSCNIDTEGDLVNREEVIELCKQHAEEDDKKEKVDEVAPKGWEGTVKAMKKHKDIDNPWALAHWMKGKGYESHKKESVNESVEPLMEGMTFEELMERFPHEHKMCQEGWGMDENMYEALCDHYFKEGRIPYKVWHGPLEELRNHVEKCYMEDTGTVMDEAFKPGPASTGDMHRQMYPDTAKPFKHTPTTVQTPRQTPFSVDPINAVTDRVHDAAAKMGGFVKKKMGLGEEDMEESALERALRQGVAEQEQDMAEGKKLDEKYMGFDKTVAAIKKGGSAENPEAVAAAIGRKKYGKEKFQKAAAAGKKLGESDLQMESWEFQLNAALMEGLEQHTPVEESEHVEECGEQPTGGNEILKALAALLGAGGMHKASPMSVAGDTGAQAIEVVPVAPDEVMGQLAQDKQADDGAGDFDFIKRMLGARMGGDYAEEKTNEGQTQTASPGDAHMSPLSQVEEEEDLEEVSRGEWIKQQDARAEKSGKDKFKAFGQTFDTDDVHEDATSDEDAMALSSEANRDAALATAYAQDNHTNDDMNIAEGDEMCNECGGMMYEGHTCEEAIHESEDKDEEHDHDDDHDDKDKDDDKDDESEKLDEWANSPAGQSADEEFQTEMDFMTKMISGGLNNIKRDQTTLPNTRVDTKAEATDPDVSIAEQLRKLAGIN